VRFPCLADGVEDACATHAGVAANCSLHIQPLLFAYASYDSGQSRSLAMRLPY
jgi:hypothetical protein